MTSNANGTAQKEAASSSSAGTGVAAGGAGSSGGQTAGFLFRFIQEGWLRKRWRKRWCVLTDGKLRLYESEPVEPNEKGCGELDLSLYQKCAKAGKKESKKSPFTLVLEVKKKDHKSKSSSKIHRELFYASSAEDCEKWFRMLAEAVAIATMGEGANLEHVTKSRPKPPGARRRPPTRQHIRDRATVCEISLDLEEERKKESTKRGHVPTSAIKPPPKLNKNTPNDPPDDLPPPPDVTAPPPDDVTPSAPPPPPSKALKPPKPASLPESPHSSAAPSRGGSVSSGGSQQGATQSSFRSTSSDTRSELLKANAKLMLMPSSDEESVNIGKQMRAKSLNMLDDLDDDLPPPPDLPKARSSLKLDRKERKKKKRPKSSLIL